MKTVKKIASILISIVFITAFVPEITFATEVSENGESTTVESTDRGTVNETDEVEVQKEESPGAGNTGDNENAEDQEQVFQEQVSNDTDTSSSESDGTKDEITNEKQTVPKLQLRGANRDGSTLTGEGTDGAPYEISSEDDLITMVSMVEGGEAGAYYIQTEDIEVTADSINPIGSASTPFTGSFDGQSHKITGYKQRLTADDGNYGGLFGYAENAVIKNIVMESVNINNTGSNAYAGGIVGYMEGGTLTNCKTLSGSVSSGYYAGGVVGYLSLEGTITGFENGATVSGSTLAGGIVGVISSYNLALSRMKNTGAVNGDKAGGITGGSGKISSSNNSGAITGTTYAGGISGESGSAVTDCSNTGKVKAEIAGGIIGHGTSSSSVAKSSNQGEISGSVCIGGIMGERYGSGSSGTTVSASYNTGRITGTGNGPYVGGIIGHGISGSNPQGSIENCYNTGKITGKGYNSGIGIVSTVKTSYNIGVISGGSNNFAIGQYTATNCYYLTNRGTGVNGATSLTPEQMEDQESFSGFDFDSINPVWTMAGIEEYPYPELNAVEMVDIENYLDMFAGGKGTPRDPYHIRTTEQFVNMQLDPDAYYILDNDIEFVSADFRSDGAFYNEGRYIEPVGKDKATPFTGSFDGQSHKITGYKQRLTADDGNYGGLFGYAENAVIKNIVMESVNINNTGSNAYAGGIVGYMEGGTLTNCKTLSGSVSSGYYAGGVVGYLSLEGTITGFENGATVSGSTLAGGIVGVISSYNLALSRMKNTGAVNGDKAGGITGGSGKISSSNNSGAITGTTYAGGISGESGSAVTDCSNTGKVKAEIAGGIIGHGTSSSSVAKSSNQGEISGSVCIGGIMGERYGSGSSGTTVSASYNTGRITGTGNGPYVGGIIGHGISGSNPQGSIENCYNTGKITGKGYNSGIGIVSTVKTSYNIGVISGGSNNFAIGQYTATNCYYLTNRGTGVNGATSLTPEQMEDQESFANFNFTEIWTMTGVEEYPYPELVSVGMTTDKIDAVEIIKEAKEIIQKIDALPETITLENETAVKEIRNQYNDYIEQYGEEALEISNLDTLTAAEAIIADLNYEELHKLENAEFDAIEDITYNRGELTPEPTIRIGETVLTKGTDYTLEYSGNINVGTATITATGAGDYTGTNSTTFNIKAKEITPAIEIAETSIPYNGSAIEPDATVKDGNTVLTADTDYTVQYTNNTNAGTASVKVTLKGNYAGENTAEFTITAKEITPTVELSETSFTYDGSAKEPQVTVKDGSTVLTADTDYTVEFNSNKNAGTASVKATLKGNYAGEKTEQFTISAKEITPVIELSPTVFAYDGNAKEPQVTVKDETTVLSEGTDYTFDYSDNVEIGTATVSVVLKGNYNGNGFATFTIKDQQAEDLENAKDDAKNQLDNYINLSDYRSAEQTQIAEIIEEAKAALENAADETEVASILANAKSSIDKIKTNAQITAEERAAQATQSTQPTQPTQQSANSNVIQDLAVVKILTPKAAKRSATIKWKKLSKKNLKKTKKIQIQYSLKKNFKTGVKTRYASAKKTALKIKGLKSKKKYYVRIRAYTKTGGKIHISKWSKVRVIKVK